MAPHSSLRFEFLLPVEPYRIIWTCNEKSRRILQNQPMGPEEADAFDGFLLDLRNRITAEKLNLGMQRLSERPAWIYPSLRAFEGEIIWAVTCSILGKEEDKP